MFISADTLDDVLRKVYGALLDGAQLVSATRGTNSELLGVQIEIKKPRARLSRTESRGRPFSALGELMWYLSKGNKLEFILPYIPAYEKESDDGLTVYGGYGPRIYAMRGEDQFNNIINILRKKPHSRRAVIQIFDAADNSSDYKEIPCTLSIQFLIRDHRLNLIVNMRSNDALLGLPHDVFCFTMIQELAARTLDLDLGIYRHFAGSLHLYEKDHDRARQFLSEGYQRTVEMPSMPPGDPTPALKKLFDAERSIRSKKALDPNILDLDVYWKDLVRLLQLHFSDGDLEALENIRKGFHSDVYRIFVDSIRDRKPLRIGKSAQGALEV